jgi:heat shock protein HspQ
VHDTSNLVYTPEQSLMEDESAEEVENPAVEMLFTRSKTGQYQRRVALQ